MSKGRILYVLYVMIMIMSLFIFFYTYIFSMYSMSFNIHKCINS